MNSYSYLLSDIELGFPLIVEHLKARITKDTKALIIPLAFAQELDQDKFANDYFLKNGKRYNKYFEPLIKVGVLKENIEVINCYLETKESFKRKIKGADIIVLPGGNPEMLYQKIALDYDLLYDFKYFTKIIIGESAGACLQFSKYFITAKNNYYKYFAFYPGLGLIKDNFWIDVHSSDNFYYLQKLQNISHLYHKNIYCLKENGAICFNRHTGEIIKFGQVKTIT